MFVVEQIQQQKWSPVYTRSLQQLALQRQQQSWPTAKETYTPEQGIDIPVGCQRSGASVRPELRFVSRRPTHEARSDKKLQQLLLLCSCLALIFTTRCLVRPPPYSTGVLPSTLPDSATEYQLAHARTLYPSDREGRGLGKPLRLRVACCRLEENSPPASPTGRNEQRKLDQIRGPSEKCIHIGMQPLPHNPSMQENTEHTQLYVLYS